MIRVIICILFSVIGMTLVKLDKVVLTINININSTKLSIGSFTIIGIIFYGISFLLLMSIIQKNELTYIYPIITGAVTLLTFLVGIVGFQEHISLSKTIGTILVLGGIIIININK